MAALFSNVSSRTQVLRSLIELHDKHFHGLTSLKNARNTNLNSFFTVGLLKNLKYKFVI